MRSHWLVVSATRLNAPCGSCTIVPDPYTGYVFSPGMTGANGASVVTFALPPLPSLTSMTFYQQWIVAGTVFGPGPCMGAALSNGLEVRIQ